SKVAQDLFTFTPAETALALELANGLSLEEAALKLGITRNTGRAHLRSIFAKTGIKRQAELVKVLLNSIVSLGPGEIAEVEERPAPVIIQPERRFTSDRSEEHTSELQSRENLVCRLLLAKKKDTTTARDKTHDADE